MARRAPWLGIAGLIAHGCVADPLEGSGRGAAEGTPVEVMLIPLDDGASPSQGGEAFDDSVRTTESLEGLAGGDGVYVVGVADGWGIALVPTNLTDDAIAAATNAPGDPAEDPSEDDEPAVGQEPDAPASCAADCNQWCESTLDLCEGAGDAECDCTSAVEDPAAPACVWTCDEWCASAAALCDGDGFAECDCGGGAPEEPSCVWTCDEWCTSSADLCDGDGAEVCGDACEWTEAQALPPSASAGAWTAPIVIGGVALLIVFTDPEVQAALDRGESIGNAVGGTYGRRAEEIMGRLRQLARETGELYDDARRPCADLLSRQGYTERLGVAAGESIRVGICMQDQLTVWPRDLTIRAGNQATADLSFANLGSGLRTVLTRDATVGWTEEGQARSVVVPEGGGTRVTLPLGAGSLSLTVLVPRDDSSTRLTVTVTR